MMCMDGNFVLRFESISFREGVGVIVNTKYIAFFYVALAVEAKRTGQRVPIGFTAPGISLMSSGFRGFKNKIGVRFGIESMLGRCNAKNNPRDNWIARNFGSGLRD